MFFNNSGFCVHNCHPSNCCHCRSGYSSSAGCQTAYNNYGMFRSSCNNVPPPVIIVDNHHHNHHHDGYGNSYNHHHHHGRW